MKRCQYCGKEYADKLVVCPTDGQPLIDPQVIPKPAANGTVFNATLTAPVSRSGQYRIYVRSGDLIFILIEGTANSILNAIPALLGPFGAAIPFFLWLFSRHKARNWNQRLAEADPEDLIREDEKNFRLHLSEIREATLGPPSSWRLNGKSAGCLNLLIRQGEKMKLELSSPADLETARQLLEPRLPSILQVNGEWDEARQRFRKRKASAPA
ncbi:MAG: hypothetical protein ACLQAH_17795 [Limisphaerales bacterium]